MKYILNPIILYILIKLKNSLSFENALQPIYCHHNQLRDLENDNWTYSFLNTRCEIDQYDSGHKVKDRPI